MNSQKLSHLLFYVSPILTPDLVPMWEAFHVFATSYATPGSEPKLRQDLKSHGMAAAGMDLIFDVVAEHRRLNDSLTASVGPKQVEFVWLQRAYLDKHSWSQEARTRLSAALARGDTSLLSRDSPKSQSEMEELMHAWKFNAPAEVSAASLLALKNDLSESDFRALRRYLLDVVVAGTGPVLEFDPATEG